MNPFIITSYRSPEFFCNRNSETARLRSAALNGRSIVLTSLRRMGKTGLIKHLFYSLEKEEDIYSFYIDIQQTNDLNEFLNCLLNGLIRNRKKGFFDRVLDFVKRFRPTLSFDPNTGNPELSLAFVNEQERKMNIESVFNYLESLDKRVVIAIDEFQTITNYPEKSVEAFLRSHIQHLRNISFIFSGSSTHILQAMFYSYNRPFYQSAELLHLGRLNEKDYSQFIKSHFENTQRVISDETILKCLQWAENHTFYVQYLLNMIWGSGQKTVDDKLLLTIQSDIINARNALYANYHLLLGNKQYRLLKAIALNNGVEKPSAGTFLSKYKLGAASSVNSAISVLLDKELIYKEQQVYKVYDVFLSKWFQMNKF